MNENDKGLEVSASEADKIMHLVVTAGDLSRLTPGQKTQYYKMRCDAASLDWRAQPFAYIKLNGKEVLYALKGATDQLTAIHGIKVEILSQANEAGLRVVTVRATTRDGRQTDEIGAVPIEGLKGEALCTAFMKCNTKAKRRAVLSICGLGLLDETEVQSITGPNIVTENSATPSEAGSIDPVRIKLDFEWPDPEMVQAEVPEVVELTQKHRVVQTKAAPVEMISENQRRLLIVGARKLAMGPTEIKQILLENYGITSTKDIPANQFDSVLMHLGLK